MKEDITTMAQRLRFNVDYKWFIQFDDFDKLKCLNQAITNRGNRWDVNTNWYKEYIARFFYDSTFNLIYKKWVDSDYEYYRQPSIDHILPTSKGGTNELDNLRFLTWFENRCKNNMSQKDWDKIKNNIKDYFI